MRLRLWISVVAMGLFCLSSPAAADQEAQRRFEEALKKVMPVSPGQVQQAQEKKKARKRVIRGKPAKIVNRTINLVVQPGMETPVIRILQGYVTTLAFFDESGAPWPMAVSSPGNPELLEVIRPKTEDYKPGNLLTVSPKEEGGHSNVALALETLTLPVNFRFEAEENSVRKPPVIDGIVTVQVAAMGPRANPPIPGKRPRDPVTRNLLSYIDGIAPAGALPVSIEPRRGDLEAWRQDGRLVLRTQHPVIWPDGAVVRGPTGIRVYEVSMVKSILVSIEGKITRLKVREPLRVEVNHGD